MGKNKGLGGLEVLRLYRAPRVGALLLACEKCRRRLVENGHDRRLTEIQTALDAASSHAADAMPFRMLRSGCMKVCPEDGVTLCALVAGAHTMPQPVVVRDANEVAAFFAAEIGVPAPSADVVSEAGLEPATVSLEG